ncbi:uncharacterized protein LOC131890413 [Tigriopus californicus]|uniref:uncharacterized protein LOC131890413 n=1 Tax=Tigriopus californicus TaxID=6832 RepID=UPI0027DA6C55|nr:uncharacterized protein LOC131890413 [Tigriopus californicus]
MELKFLKIVLLVICLAGFAWQILDHVQKFWDAQTTESSSWEPRDLLQFPMMVFCDSRGFTDYQPFTQVPYESVALKAQVNLAELVHATLTFDLTEDAYITQNLPTMNNGICQTVTFKETYPVRVALQFFTNITDSYQMFLANPGTEMYFMDQSNIRPVPKIDLSRPLTIELWMNNFIKRDTLCEPDIVEADQVECVRTEIIRRLQASRVQCLPYPMFQQFPILPICNTSQAQTDNYLEARKIVRNTVYNYKEIGCLMPCVENQVNMNVVTFGEKANLIPNKFTFYVIYLYDGVNVKQQYRLMDFATIVAAVGGSLSLFLGISCFGVTWKLIEFIHSKFERHSGPRSLK